MIITTTNYMCLSSTKELLVSSSNISVPSFIVSSVSLLSFLYQSPKTTKKPSSTASLYTTSCPFRHITSSSKKVFCTFLPNSAT